VKPYVGGVRHDYKDVLTDRATGRRGWSWFALGLSLPLLTVALLLVSERNESKVPVPAVDTALALVAAPSDEEPLRIPLTLPELASIEASEAPALQAAEELLAADAARLDLTVARGDSLDVLFRRNDLDLGDLAAMVGLSEAAEYLKILKPGDSIELTHAGRRVLSLRRELNEIDVLAIDRVGDGFVAEVLHRDVERRTVGAHGVIRTSLFEAGVDAGMADAVTMQMAHMFQWDIDFIQDVRVGDSFTVVYEELWRDGDKLRNGEIVAAEFVNQGKVFRAARYVDTNGDSGYYTPEGRSVRRAFVRAPVEFTRISSNFNPNRRHPVLNTLRAHQGVDYAAPTGTPVIAAGDGKVTFRGTKGGYGNAVILQHGDNISTLYGHLSRFGKQRSGARVKQGEVIGYVGQSGLATGPHLHYEYRIGGVHKNPRTVPLPMAEPVSPEYRDDFLATTSPLWRQLDVYQQTRFVATAD
jgi:murein DD-endopeptidase MepM/ murein hydrolase activator NlpD